MGVRLFKRLGWGLTGLDRSEDGTLTDPRINVEALRRRDVGVGYLKYLKALRDKESEQSDAWFDLAMGVTMAEEALSKEGELPWPVTCESDRGSPGLLLVQPVGFSNWTRYGDAIDQNEENALYPDEYYRIVPMLYGIYPFEGLYMDSRDGRRLDTTTKRLLDHLLEKQKNEDDPKYRKVADKLAATMGFDDAEQAKEHIAPIVPPDIRHVCSWLDLFTSPDVVLQLRPMLYAYWV